MPTLNRDRWETHPNFPAQLLLLGSHANFRRANRRLIDWAGVGALNEVEAHYTGWIAAMRSHERYEEHKLYPFLAQRFNAPDAFDTATEGHEALHAAYDDVMDALARHDKDDVVRALRSHDEILNAHLDHEEELVVPALLELRPSEFHEYTSTDIVTLLTRLNARRTA